MLKFAGKDVRGGYFECFDDLAWLAKVFSQVLNTDAGPEFTIQVDSKTRTIAEGFRIVMDEPWMVTAIDRHPRRRSLFVVKMEGA